MTTLALLSLIITTAALFGWVSSRVLRLPITIGTMLLTVAASLILNILSRRIPGLDTWVFGLVGRIKFEDLILHGMLALLLFAGSFLLDLVYLSREKLAVSLLSLPGTLLSTAAPGGFDALHIAAAGDLRSLDRMPFLRFTDLSDRPDRRAGDASPGRSFEKHTGSTRRGILIERRRVGAVLFLAVLDASRGSAPSIYQIGSLLILKAGGGLLLGSALAWIASQFMRRVDAYQIEILLTLALALGGYSLAETFRLSAPLEAVAAGLALRRFNLHRDHTEISHDSLDHFWGAIDEVQNAVLFVLLGLEVLVISFTHLTFASGALAIVGVAMVRTIVVAAILGLVRLLQPGHKTSILTLSWGGLRGGLSIALALSVPESQGRGWILATTYFVVVFSIVIQGGTLDLFSTAFAPAQTNPLATG